jgi:sulfofructosephosphate aldolase
MPPDVSRKCSGLDAIARASGGFAMVAIDQRESLRIMFQAKQPEPVSDETLKAFKVAIAETLGGHASAMLFDRQFGLPAMERGGEVHPQCGRILAVDRLIQEPGQAVTDTELDETMDVAEMRRLGAEALKFLLFWKGPDSAERCRQLAERFTKQCRENGFISVLEAMVRPPLGSDPSAWDREEALLDAARVMAESRPDLYKGEIPLFGRGDPRVITEKCRAISDRIRRPWVVLSQGVARDDFAEAVRAACQGGASGFLAGRAIWADIIGPGDITARLKEHSASRLAALTEIVVSAATPWRSAGH